MNEILKPYFNKNNCNNIGYNKLVTSSNNPKISKAMRFSQMANSNHLKQITYARYAELYGPTPPPPTPPAKNNILFMTLYF